MSVHVLLPAAILMVVLASSAAQAAAIRRQAPQPFSPEVRQDYRSEYSTPPWPAARDESVSGSYGAVVHGYNPVHGAF